MHRLLSRLTCIIFLFISSISFADNSTSIPILTYHNFHPTKPGSMTISTQKFEAQLQWLKENGYTVIPLSKAVAYLQGKNISLPKKSVVITADDGRVTVYTYMLPIVKKYHIPVTLFIYPTSISNANYALTWNQIKEMQMTGLFDVQSHTYWHPNFNDERRSLTTDKYQALVHEQLVTSKNILHKKLGTDISLLAWPYGIYDHYLEQQATNAGYVMAFSVDDRSANISENKMAMPRYLLTEKQSMQTFEKIVDGTIQKIQGKK